MPFILKRCTEEPVIEEDHTTINAIATEDRPLSRVIEEITRAYSKPVLLIWYTPHGILEYHYISYIDQS